MKAKIKCPCCDAEFYEKVVARGYALIDYETNAVCWFTPMVGYLVFKDRKEADSCNVSNSNKIVRVKVVEEKE